MSAPDQDDATGLDLESLGPVATWRAVAAELSAAVGSSRHPLHLLTVATIAADGGPDARTVVLRRFDPDLREAWFHTDIRSPKAAAIRRDPRVALHWYAPSLRLQIRMRADARLHHHDATARDAWRHSRPMSRACYTSPHAPGEPVVAFPSAPAAPEEDDDRGLASFAAVCCTFTSVELLALHASGHQRARLEVGSTPASWMLIAP